MPCVCLVCASAGRLAGQGPAACQQQPGPSCLMQHGRYQHSSAPATISTWCSCPGNNISTCSRQSSTQCYCGMVPFSSRMSQHRCRGPLVQQHVLRQHGVLKLPSCVSTHWLPSQWHQLGLGLLFVPQWPLAGEPGHVLEEPAKHIVCVDIVCT